MRIFIMASLQLENISSLKQLIQIVESDQRSKVILINEIEVKVKCLLRALDEAHMSLRISFPEGVRQIPRLQTVEDLEGDDLLLYDAEMELMNMILLSIPNEIYNYVDALVLSAKDIGNR
ncbi:hypothetical protein Tco_0347424 [Tanacetum coccineum]